MIPTRPEYRNTDSMARFRTYGGFIEVLQKALDPVATTDS